MDEKKDKMETSQMSNCGERDHLELSESKKGSSNRRMNTFLHNFALFIYVRIQEKDSDALILGNMNVLQEENYNLVD